MRSFTGSPDPRIDSNDKYSLHPGGPTSACDGSVRFIKQSIQSVRRGSTAQPCGCEIISSDY